MACRLGVAAGMQLFGYAPGNYGSYLAEAGAIVFTDLMELIDLRWL